ncbi:MAG: hypothetical protein H6869_09065 [Rhodospirillales bacterium]|nr:hypothetical protein [Rhodospirillales bacterium]
MDDTTLEKMLENALDFKACATNRIFYHSILHAFTHPGRLRDDADENRTNFGTVIPVYIFENGYPVVFRESVKPLLDHELIEPDIEKVESGVLSYKLSALGRQALALLDRKDGPSWLEQHWDEPAKFSTRYKDARMALFGHVVKITPPKL